MSQAKKESAREILRYYRALYRVWGPQHWWPAETRFEVIVGAYLTQNTAWTNVELALGNLRKARVLSGAGIRKVSLEQTRAADSSVGLFPPKGCPAQNVRRFSRQGVRRLAESTFRPADRSASRRVARLKRRGTRNCGLDLALCREIIRCSSWMLTLDAFWFGMESCRKGHSTKRFAHCFSGPWSRWLSNSRSRPRAWRCPSKRACTAPLTALSHEHSRAHGPGAGLQRDARAHCGNWKKLLSKITAQM